MRYFILTLLGFVLTFGFSPAAHAQIEKFILDKPHTQIVFSINHLGFSNSIGKFTDYEGSIMLDQGEPAKSSVDIIIKTASLDLDDEKWNEHMKNADFFNVEKFPEMTFKSTKVEVTGEKTANVTGDLTMLGVTKPVVLAVVLNKIGKHPMADKQGAGFSAIAKIRRSDFGLSYGTPMVSDDVDIRIEVEAYGEDATGEGTTNP